MYLVLSWSTCANCIGYCDAGKDGVFMWPQPFLVSIGDESGASCRKKLPVLLVDVTRCLDKNGSTSVHFFKGKLASIQDFVDRINGCIRDWDTKEAAVAAAESAETSRDLVFLSRAWSSRGRQDWRTVDTFSLSRECFLVPDSDARRCVSQNLLAIVCHMFGDVCGNQHMDKRLIDMCLSHSVQVMQEVEPEVNRVVAHYKNQMTEKITSDPFCGQQVLANTHNQLIKQLFEVIRSINCPAQTTLNRVTALNQLLPQLFQQFLALHADHKETRIQDRVQQLHDKYVQEMTAVLSVEAVLDNRDLEQKHRSLMTSCLSDMRSVSHSGAPLLEDLISQSFIGLRRSYVDAQMELKDMQDRVLRENLQPYSDQESDRRVPGLLRREHGQRCPDCEVRD